MLVLLTILPFSIPGYADFTLAVNGGLVVVNLTSVLAILDSGDVSLPLQKEKKSHGGGDGSSSESESVSCDFCNIFF